MYKISVIGIDKSGKTSTVNRLKKESIPTIYLTSNAHYDSRLAKGLSNVSDLLKNIGEKNDLKALTGFAYMFKLLPYKLEENAKKSYPLLVSDRDPIIDVYCYSKIYLDRSKKLRPFIRNFLETQFQKPDKIIYLQTSPEVALDRMGKYRQLHETKKSLTLLSRLYDKKIMEMQKKGTSVKTINTDNFPLEAVIEKVLSYVKFNQIYP